MAMKVNLADLGISTTELKKGVAVIREGETPVRKEMYFVIRGELVVIKNIGGVNEVVENLKSGAFFGELGMVSDKPRAASVIVRSDSAKIGVLDRDTFIHISEKQPEFVMHLLKKILQWVINYQERLLLIQKQYNELDDLINDAVFSTPEPEVIEVDGDDEGTSDTGSIESEFDDDEPLPEDDDIMTLGDPDEGEDEKE